MAISHKSKDKRSVRHRRIRARMTGTAKRPRLSIHRSNTRIYAQIIDDSKGVTLASAESGKEIAKLAIAKGVKRVVFDRGGFIYTGRVRKFAEEAREGGLEF